MWRATESTEDTVCLGELIVDVGVNETYVTILTNTFFPATIRQKKEAGLLRIRPLATEVTGGSVAPLIPWELAEGGSAGRG